MQDQDIQASSILDVVRDHYEVKNREEEFKIDYTSTDGQRSINFKVNGVKRQLGIYMYVYMCIYVYIYICIFICVYICIYV
jgi:hypothetical protein